MEIEAGLNGHLGHVPPEIRWKTCRNVSGQDFEGVKVGIAEFLGDRRGLASFG